MTRLLANSFILLLVMRGAGVFAQSTVVFDSLSQPAGGGHGFVDSLEIGQSVSLVGSARMITEFRVLLEATLPDIPFRARFYRLDGPNGAPQTLFWESATEVMAFGNRPYAINVPSVLAPDSFAWTIAPEPYSNRLGIATGEAAVSGVMLGHWRRNTSGWMPFSYASGGFGAQVLAVPEPAGIIEGVLSLGLPAVVRRRRRTALQKQSWAK